MWLADGTKWVRKDSRVGVHIRGHGMEIGGR